MYLTQPKLQTHHRHLQYFIPVPMATAYNTSIFQIIIISTSPVTPIPDRVLYFDNSTNAPNVTNVLFGTHLITDTGGANPNPRRIFDHNLKLVNNAVVKTYHGSCHQATLEIGDRPACSLMRTLNGYLTITI